VLPGEWAASEVAEPVPMQRKSVSICLGPLVVCCGAFVRFWHKADIPRCPSPKDEGAPHADTVTDLGCHIQPASARPTNAVFSQMPSNGEWQ